jgi:hypothetical protein
MKRKLIIPVGVVLLTIGAHFSGSAAISTSMPSRVSEFIYPHCKLIKPQFGSEDDLYLSKFFTEDDAGSVIDWYQKKFTGAAKPRSQGILWSPSIARAVMDDSQKLTRHGHSGERSVLLEVLSKKTRDYTVNVVVSKAKDERETHVIVTFINHLP